MICPTCSTHIPDGSVICPACHASVGVTVAMPALQGRWCPSCGVAVAWDEQVCPHCGLPIEQAWGEPLPEGEVASTGPEELTPEEQLVSDEADTKVIPRIESALPAENDPTSKVAVHEAMPRVRGILLAGIAAVTLVGGLALYLSHPWNPGIHDDRATEEADTSMAGFPGTVETLSGQDSDGSPKAETLSGDEATLAELTDAYQKLGRYEQRADESEELFGQVAYGSDSDERARGKREADMLAIDVSNLIAKISVVDVTSGTYAEDRDNLLTLGNWLRNRVDVLTQAWAADLASEDPAADEEAIRAVLASDHDESGQSTYKRLFDENYAQWEPREKEDSD